MTTFEKGLSYNFIIERIAEAKGNYYYVIQVEHKECWIKMYPFEIYQGSKRTSYDVNIEGETLLALTYSLKTNYQFYTSYTKKTKNMNLAM